eukprot:5790105-Prymnesium_polylepis.1
MSCSREPSASATPLCSSSFQSMPLTDSQKAARVSAPSLPFLKLTPFGRCGRIEGSAKTTTLRSISTTWSERKPPPPRGG